MVPLLSNDRNHDSWPQVVSADVTRHSHRLKSDVYVVSGQAKGKTLLPLPVGADKVDMEDDKYVVSTTVVGYVQYACIMHILSFDFSFTSCKF